MSVHTLPDGRVICKYPKGTNPDKPNNTKTYFGRGTGAENAAWKKNDEYGLSRGKTVTSPNFFSLVNAYLDAKEDDLALSTYDKMVVRMDGTILPAIGAEQAHRLTKERIAEYVRERSKEWVQIYIGKEKKTGSNIYKNGTRKVSKGTIHREVTDIRTVLRWAVSWSLISNNPMEGYEMPKQNNVVIPPPSKPEFDAILACATPHLKRAMLISYYTGLRPGKEELLTLTWDLVDFHNKTITVISAQKGGLAKRVIPLHKNLNEPLNQWYAEDEKLCNSGRNDIGRRYIVNFNGHKIDSLKSSWKSAKKRAKVTRRLRMYDMRHAFATGMLRKGASLKSVSELLGHASPEITARVYQHVDTAEKRDPVDLLD